MTLEAEATGSQAAKEHDYIGLAEQQQQNPLAGKSSSSIKVSAGGLNMRRTELQLGLPGSPQEDELEQQQQRSNGFHKNGSEQHHGDKEDKGANGSSAKSKPAQPQQPARFAPSVTPDAQAWHPQQQQQQQQRSSSSSSSCHLKPPDLHECVEKHVVEDASQSRAPVGWPPVQSFRKNSLAAPTVHHAKTVDSLSNPSSPAAAAAAAAATPGTSSQHQAAGSQLVKVYMDGVPIGRKVNLRTHSSYERLSGALEEMFRRFISGQSGAGKAVAKDKLVSDTKKFNFIYGSDYVLTYEDKDGDLMLVGDVPWEMFVGAVKRLRIMKGSEAIGLAPRAAEDQLTAANK
ncbi:hypothetical protein SELMODRAFT_187180 [Selaginella moellendorffii]|uniref:Auxin-responsive protein n=1 Tax=Selaginella moellendorffii TaxID=88036 RepID=D8TBT7_SELML|nr:auxin-responsive protein IAA16 [Selaginella moellendorffii]EFJ05906.1 hypothetical protein SELMODRAFT_187180 [Selaginella moellendorffii]|eukprot:XP_002993067.1 auxin-responsive protein IAA16 [Selaginella moellendorffii]